jgi:hypothetical protein
MMAAAREASGQNGRVVATDYAPDVGWFHPFAPRETMSVARLGRLAV